MNGKLSWSIFWALVGVFVVIVSWFFVATAYEFARGFRFGIFLVSSGTVFVLLGAALLFLTVKTKVGGKLKRFLLLTGVSAVGLPVFALLHNAIYALFIHFFGAAFWNGGDEPFLFILAIVICPIAFLVGAIGSIVLAIKRRKMAN